MFCTKAALSAALLAGVPLANAVQPAEHVEVSATAAWVRWLPNDLPAAGHVVIKNESRTPQRLMGASSPDYSSVMLHRSIRENGIDRMVMTSGVDMAPGGSLSLAPGSYHLMLMKPEHRIEPGDTVTLHLMFASGEGVDVMANVRPATETGTE
jgi:copper(I)-binding protein